MEWNRMKLQRSHNLQFTTQQIRLYRVSVCNWFFSIRFGLLWGRKWRRQRQQRAAVQIRLNNNKAHFFPQVSKPYTYLLKMSKQYCICIAMPLSRTCTVVKCQIQFVYWYCVNRIRVTHTWTQTHAEAMAYTQIFELDKWDREKAMHTKKMS